MIEVTTLPLTAEFDAADVVPLPAGLVGLHRANRQGSGSEPAEVRPFRTGDRLRRINWKVSSRTGELHVTSTWADRDTHVLLLLDTDIDLGASGGVDGRSSSLDIAVRAAAAIAQHYLRSRRPRRAARPRPAGARHPRPGAGAGTCAGVLDALVVAEPSPAHNADLLRVRPVEAGAMVVAFSPLVGQHGRAHVLSLAQHGHIVIVVDTLPPDPPPRRVAVGLRWPSGCARWSARPTSTSSPSSACPSCRGGGRARSTTSCATPAGSPAHRGRDERARSIGRC